MLKQQPELTDRLGDRKNGLMRARRGLGKAYACAVRFGLNAHEPRRACLDANMPIARNVHYVIFYWIE